MGLPTWQVQCHTLSYCLPRAGAELGALRAVKQPAQCDLATNRQNRVSDRALFEPGDPAFMSAALLPSL